MEDSIHKHSRVGAAQQMSYPQGNPMGSLKAVCKDDFLNAIELGDYGYKNEEMKGPLEQSHLGIHYGVQLRFLGGKLNPNDLDGEGRKKAGTTLIRAVDKAECLDAKGIAFLAGKWQPETKEQAYTQLLKTTQAIYDYSVGKGMMVELEVFDYGMGKTVLIDPVPHVAEFVADMRTTHSNSGLLVDLSHFPTTYGANRFVTHTLRPYITHSHFGNAVVVKGCDSYDNLRSKFGYPSNVNDTPQSPGYLKVMKEGDFFDAKNPYVLPMGVILCPGKDEDIVLVDTKRVLKRVWILLGDNAQRQQF